MPERPELDYQRDQLNARVAGQQITGAEVREPLVLRRLLEATAEASLVGQRIEPVRRRAHFLLFDLSGPAPATLMAVHPMLAGRFWLGPPGERVTKDTALRLKLSGGEELRYRDDERMGKVYLCVRAQEPELPGLDRTGIDVLSAAFTPAKLQALAKGRREQLKTFLLDKRTLDALGNAYADEVLFAARLHPKRRVSELSKDELRALHAAIVGVLSDAAAAVRAAAPPLEAKLRDHLRVRNRKGAPCSACGEPVRVCGVNGHDAFFCGRCQVDPAGRGLIDWSRLAAHKEQG